MFLRERLERLRGELRARLGVEENVVREGEQFIEEMDSAEQTREQDDALRFTNRDEALLREVEAALARMQTGRYGISEISGEPIPFKRLEAVPWARAGADEE